MDFAILGFVAGAFGFIAGFVFGAAYRCPTPMELAAAPPPPMPPGAIHFELPPPAGKGWPYPYAAQGGVLRAARMRAGLKQGDVAGLIGVSQNTLSRMELGALRPSEDARKALEMLFGFDVLPAWPAAAE